MVEKLIRINGTFKRDLILFFVIIALVCFMFFMIGYYVAYSKAYSVCNAVWMDRAADLPGWCQLG